MKRAFFIVIIFSLGLVTRGFSQSFHLDFLFNPGITVGSEYVAPSAFNDSTDFQLVKYKTQFVLPLKTKLGVKGLKWKDFSFKDLDLKASQIFLNTKFSVIQPSLSQENNFENIYNGNIGITALTASIKNGIWLYSANLYFAENATTISESPMPNFLGYVAKVKIESLKFQYFYGASILVNQGKFYPVPIIGVSQKFSSKFKGSIIFPLEAKLSYKPDHKTSIDLVGNFDGVNSIFREGSEIKGNDNSLNYRQFKSYIGMNTKFGDHFKIFFEVGYSSFRKMTAITNDYSETIDPSLYVSFSINYRFGDSVFNNFVNRKE